MNSSTVEQRLSQLEADYEQLKVAYDDIYNKLKNLIDMLPMLENLNNKMTPKSYVCSNGRVSEIKDGD